MRVVVTRPEPGATATALLLGSRGHEPLRLPLSRIAPAEPAEWPDPDRFDAVLVTSANAIAHVPGDIAKRYGQLVCFAVGERTALAASQAGLMTVVSAGGDARSLAELVMARMPASSRLLYLCGQRRRLLLEQELGSRGYQIVALETYRTDPVEYAPEDIATVLGSGTVGAVLLYSPFAAERFSALLEDDGSAPQLRGARVLCMSAQIADSLSCALRAGAEVAASPDEDALIALLGRGG